MHILATNIQWEFDNEDEQFLADMPAFVLVINVPNTTVETIDAISNLLSDQLGYCHNGWQPQLVTRIPKFHGTILEFPK